MHEAKRNHRPLTAITADICKLERTRIFTLAKLLREARDQCEHGKWLPYLKSIDWSPRTAQLYMSVADLADKYETVAHLNAAPTALYHLVWQVEDGEKRERFKADDYLPLAIERLRASVARGDSAAEQREVVLLTHMAMINPPGTTDLTLKAASDAINQNCFGDSVRFQAMRDQGQAIIKANPKTKDELAIVQDEHPIPAPAMTEEVEALKGLTVVVDEAEEDEAPPTGKEPKDDLPQRQRAMVDRFDDACGELLDLSAKASLVFTNSDIDDADLDMLGNFLKQVAVSKRKAA